VSSEDMYLLKEPIQSSVLILQTRAEYLNHAQPGPRKAMGSEGLSKESVEWKEGS